MTSTTGGCLCGSVRYQFKGPFLWAAHCHCESCRKNTASPLTTYFGVALKGFEFIGEEPGLYHSSPGVTRRFCARCGTPVSYQNVSLPDEIHLYAAGLDDHADFRPESHVFWEERVSWLHIEDELPKKGGFSING